MLIKPVTRSHKANDRHGSRSPEAQNSPPDTSHLPHYFAKRGPVNGDPTKVKKNGGGRGNWGKAGAEDEIEDSGFNLTSKQLYHPNSSAQALKEFRTKFEDNEDEIEAFERR
ncbi:hypothetical protein MPDQ_005446 [Monascus purpureus]|uniref:Hyaluronan/mRNA-binding protein domain-containing protein n=1 Tax=Monascus purpureus TaxID=5098 RepID=A0A507R0Y9_MONPU|nr:hypothetical protein MPDQ_005446 [Monascus purpureus]